MSKMDENQTDAPPPYQPGPCPPGPPDPAYPPGAYPPAGCPPGTYPPGAYQLGPYPQGPTIVVTQAPFGDKPVEAKCLHCDQSVTTKVRTEPGMLTWLVAGGLCLVGCWLGCCLIPFCVPACQDTIHTCPNCREQVGVAKRL